MSRWWWMGAMGRPALSVLATALVLLCGTAAAVFDGYDGMPRPAGMDQDPTTTYGPKPAVKYDNKAANCIWYGWENGHYLPKVTKNCSASLWASLSNANPEGLAGFMYYVPYDIYFDPSYNEYLCAIGCFDLSASGPASRPTNSPFADSPAAPSILPPDAPPPVVSAPPPVVSAPPPVTTTTPPSMAPPPPATLFRPPPPAPPLPPATAPALPPAPAPASIVMPHSPGLSPISSPEASVPGPSVVQAGSGTSTSVSTVLVYTVALILSISFLV